MGLAIPIDRVKTFLAENLDEATFREVEVTSGQPVKASEVNSRVEPGTVRILVKQKPLSLTVALKMNSEAWEIVKTPAGGAQDYEEALQKAREICLAFPNPNYINTLGVAFYRNGLYHQAVETMTEAASLHEEEGGIPHPIDLAVLAMAMHQLGETGSARSIHRQLENLMAQEVFAEDEECQQFMTELEQLLGL